MKSFIAACCLALFLVMPLKAQEETLLDMEDIEHGGYGALVVKFSSVNNQFALLVGGRGGWIINHAFVVGFAGYGLANNIPAHAVGPFGERYFDFGYGGLDLEYVFNSDRLLHLSIHTLIGGGAIGYRGMTSGSWDPDEGHMQDGFFVVEPGMNIDLNIVRWFRLSVGASFRYVRGVSVGISTNKDLGGPSAQLTFRFGKF